MTMIFEKLACQFYGKQVTSSRLWAFWAASELGGCTEHMEDRRYHMQ